MAHQAHVLELHNTTYNLANPKNFQQIAPNDLTLDICLRAIIANVQNIHNVPMELRLSDAFFQAVRNVPLRSFAKINAILKLPMTDKMWCNLINKNGFKTISYISNPSFTVCYHAVKADINALELIRNPAMKLKLCIPTAIWYKDTKICVLKHIETQAPDLILKIVKISGRNLQYAKLQNLEICEAAFAENHDSLQFAKHKTLEMCDKALDIYPSSFAYFADEYPELHEKAVELCPYNITYIKDPSYDFLKKMISKRGRIINFYKGEKPLELIMLAFETYKPAIKFLTPEQQTLEMCQLAANETKLKYLAHRTPEIIQIAIESESSNIKYVDDKSEEFYKVQTVKLVIHKFYHNKII